MNTKVNQGQYISQVMHWQDGAQDKNELMKLNIIILIWQAGILKLHY